MRLTGAVALALLAYLAALAAPLGLADLSAFAPRQMLARAPEAFPSPADPAWTRGRELLEKALALDPRNPQHAELLAQWHERAADRLPASSPAAGAQLRQSLAYFRRAALARPGSPYTWSSIALIKLRLGELDEELAGAVNNAAQYGSWEPEVQLAIADVIFAAGGRLPRDALRAARRMADNASRFQYERLLERAVKGGGLATLCSLPGASTAKFAMRCI
jgi:hypothetical protein